MLTLATAFPSASVELLGARQDGRDVGVAQNPLITVAPRDGAPLDEKRAAPLKEELVVRGLERVPLGDDVGHVQEAAERRDGAAWSREGTSRAGGCASSPRRWA